MTTIPAPEVTVETLLSRKQNEYTVTRPTADTNGPAEALAPSANPPAFVANAAVADGALGAASVTTKEDFGISVQWEPQDNDHWNNTSSSVQSKAAMTRYYIERHSVSGDGTVKCTLHITNTQHYGYHFYDETGDSYWLSTWRNGDHSLDYKSKKPNIVYVRGD